MARFNELTGDYDPAWEETAGKQIEKMLDMTDRTYYEIWCGYDGYGSCNPKEKLYDAFHDDDAKLKEITGRSIEKFKECVIPRCGCAYSLSPELYEKRTNTPFPDYIADSGIVIINFPVEWFKQHYKTKQEHI